MNIPSLLCPIIYGRAVVRGLLIIQLISGIREQMAEIKLVEAEPDSPNRCQGVGMGVEGQCRYLNYRGLHENGYLSEISDIQAASPFCPKHGGHAIKSQERRAYHDYGGSRWAAQISNFATSPEVKSLRGEIGVTRFLIQTILDQCSSQLDLAANSSRLIVLVSQAERLVSTCEKMEYRMGELLDKEAALLFASSVVDIIKAHIPDPLTLDVISTQIANALRTALETRTSDKGT